MKPLPEYKTLQEKQNFFAPRNADMPWVINTEEEFDKLYDFLIKESNADFESERNCIYYRGINEAKYKTFTSAQRHWLWNDWEDNSKTGFIEYIATELWNIRKKTAVKNYYRSLGVHPNDLLYFAFLQHYGGASPMLDLTHSLDTGLFFAFDKMTPSAENEGDINNYVSIQILDFSNYYINYFSNIVDFIDSGIKRAKEILQDWEIKHPGFPFDDSLLKDIAKLTAWYNPENPGGSLSDLHIALLDFVKNKIVLDTTGRPLYWSNLRLIAQHGAFLFYTEHEKPLEEYLQTVKAPLLRCININKSLKDYVMKKINKDKDSIYPKEEDIAKDTNLRAINTLGLAKHNI